MFIWCIHLEGRRADSMYLCTYVHVFCICMNISRQRLARACVAVMHLCQWLSMRDVRSWWVAVIQADTVDFIHASGWWCLYILFISTSLWGEIYGNVLPVKSISSFMVLQDEEEKKIQITGLCVGLFEATLVGQNPFKVLHFFWFLCVFQHLSWFVYWHQDSAKESISWKTKSSSRKNKTMTQPFCFHSKQHPLLPFDILIPSGDRISSKNTCQTQAPLTPH